MQTFEELSQERKDLQAKGHLPEWYTTQAWQMFKAKYMYEPDALYGRHKTIAKTLASYLPKHMQAYYQERFFEEMWSGRLSPASPTLANEGTNRGLGVSCSGQDIGDSVDSFYENLHEAAVLSKHAFGTSGNFDNVRGRGTPISKGGVANGVREVIDDYFTMAKKIAQGGNRRGSFAAYISIEHPDWDECIDDLVINTDGKNYGWIIKDSFITKLICGDEDAQRRFTKALHTKLITGKGYFFFIDKANRARPQMYKDLGLDVKATNLCTEIMLHSSEEYTYSCVLASLNLVHWEDIKTHDTISVANVFLDCVVEDFLQTSKDIKGLEKVRAFTEKSRAVGLGVMGFHTLCQMKRIPMDGLEASFLNQEIFTAMQKTSLLASQEMAQVLGEPEWCKGYGVRNTHRLAQAPTKSTGLLMGGVSEGINPDPGMVFEAASAAGELTRIVPVIYELMKERGVYNKDTIKRIIDNLGSVQQETWLTDEEKLVFRTAFEMNQHALLRLASQRQPKLCQGQSINLYIPGEDSEELISDLITECFLNENILSQYYIYSRNGVVVKDECVACQV